MFDIVARALSSILTILFPIFASYRALSNSSSTQQAPWLMYWVVFGCALFIESWAEWLLVWLPFYGWLRLGVHLWLVLPQTQGARMVYQEHVHPFLSKHEDDIDRFISQAHDRARALGMRYFRLAVDFFKENVLGVQPPRQAQQSSTYASAYATTGSYAQSLIARFNLPAARESVSAPNAVGDFYTILTSALSQATTSQTSRDAQVENLSASGILIPPTIRSKEERMSYISTQRERLKILMGALDKEASILHHSSAREGAAPVADFTLPSYNFSDTTPVDHLGRSKSEVSFDRVEREEVQDVKPSHERTTSSGWMPWNWTSSGADAPENKSADTPKAASTGVDIGKAP